jgi:plastocyanin
MIDHLDSRALGSADCYGQRFMRAGRYAYNVVPAGTSSFNEHRPFTIEVSESSGEPSTKQHIVVIAPSDTGLRADPPALRIQVGDLVVWSLCGATSVPYAIAGDKALFESARLVNECAYTHAFGFPGEYEWTDAYGSSLKGIVRVRDPGCKNAQDIERWRERLTKGALVTIRDGKAEPSDVEIVTGQTVFFSVVKSAGISITDRRVLERERCHHDVSGATARRV